MTEPNTAPRLGIGIVTRNRLGILRETIAQIESLTVSPYQLVLADDGSEDGTTEWAREQSIPVVTGSRRGCAWNKNRALCHLVALTSSNVLVLLEDDTRPTVSGWEREWIDAVLRWQHVNYCYGFEPRRPPPGSGTADDPYRCDAFGGHCSATTRAALGEVGYLDTRFQGYGWEHVEWTWRFALRYAQDWGQPEGLLPCLDHGITATWPASHFDQVEVDRNEAVYSDIRAAIEGPYHRNPWSNENERLVLAAEVGAAAWDLATA